MGHILHTRNIVGRSPQSLKGVRVQIQVYSSSGITQNVRQKQVIHARTAAATTTAATTTTTNNSTTTNTTATTTTTTIFFFRNPPAYGEKESLSSPHFHVFHTHRVSI